MKKSDYQFQLKSNGVSMKVEKLKLPMLTAFRVKFKGARQPLVIIPQINSNAIKFWKSIPEERQEEADEVGSLIDRYLEAVNSTAS
jgi:hypothetical protein